MQITKPVGYHFADGEVDYFVKTIADTVKSNLASFQRLGDSSGKTVAEIRIGRGEELFAEKDTSLPREDLYATLLQARLPVATNMERYGF